MLSAFETSQVFAIYSPSVDAYWARRGGIYMFYPTHKIMAARTFLTEHMAVEYLKGARRFIPDAVLVRVTIQSSVELVN